MGAQIFFAKLSFFLHIFLQTQPKMAITAIKFIQFRWNLVWKCWFVISNRGTGKKLVPTFDLNDIYDFFNPTRLIFAKSIFCYKNSYIYDTWLFFSESVDWALSFHIKNHKSFFALFCSFLHFFENSKWLGFILQILLK